MADELILVLVELDHYTQHSRTECSEGSREGSLISVLVVQLGLSPRSTKCYYIKAARGRKKHCKNASLAVGMERSERGTKRSGL